MSGSNSIFSTTSVIAESRWVVEMQKTFDLKQHVMEVHDTPPCVFRVPTSLVETGPEAYIPQRIGLGPYHHLRPDLYTMQRKKLAAVYDFLRCHNLEKKMSQLVNLYEHMESKIRESYEQYLDVEPITLAWILAIDVVYLLAFLTGYKKGGSELQSLAGDVLMMENQIPIFFVREAVKFFDYPSMFELEQEFAFFLKQVSPLVQMNFPSLLEGTVNQHLLCLLYHSFSGENRSNVTKSLLTADDAIKAAASVGLPGAGVQIAQQAVSLLERLPWQKIQDLLNKYDPDHKQNTGHIGIPSASSLARHAAIRFGLIQDRAFTAAKFDEQDKIFHLSPITLRPHSPAVLRNLLAYEAASAKPRGPFPLAKYMDLMCGLIDDAKDVEILKKEKIIVSELSDVEIASMFKGIVKSSRDDDQEEGEVVSGIDRDVETVNQQFGQVWKVKVFRWFKQHLPNIKKIVTVVSVIMLVAFFVLQAFCDLHGCYKKT